MTKIQILPQEVVNKIAAGEVVERPASVVKELIENSIDAKANTIKIEIIDGGVKKIMVSDNGVGMTVDDLKLCTLPHATSKLHSEEDLLNIRSYGFRGEALASIAAVSKLTVRSKTQESATGYEIKIDGGELKQVNEVGMANGTTAIVEDLFFNVPARLEFIKNATNEFKQLLDIVTSIAIANSNLGFSLTNDGKSVFNLAKDHQVEDRVRSLFGNDFYEKLIPIFYEHPHIEIFGFVGKPEIASSKKKEQYIFINKRPIKDKNIFYAIKETYGGLLPPGSVPAYILFIDIAENIVDVNIHPRKEEVRFSNNQLIFTAIKSAVKRALDTTTLTPGSIPGQPGMASAGGVGMMPPLASQMPGYQVAAGLGAPPLMPRPYPYMPMPGVPLPPGYQAGMGMPMMSRPMPYPMAPQPSYPTQIPTTAPTAPKPGLSGTVPLSPQPTTSRPIQSMGVPGPFWNDPYTTPRSYMPTQAPTGSLKFFKAHKLYIFTESKDGILIFDQHAVHERILYEKLTKKHVEQKSEGSKQGLLTPIVVNLSIHEINTFEEFKEELTKLGFEIEDFGPNTYKITSVPQIFSKVNIKDIFHELIEDLSHDEKTKEIDNQSDRILKYLACRSAYKAGDTITDEEVLAMITQLEKGENTYTCPHGRPVKIELTLAELAKMFKRTGFE